MSTSKAQPAVVSIASGKQLAPAPVVSARRVLRATVVLGGTQTVTLTPTQ